VLLDTGAFAVSEMGPYRGLLHLLGTQDNSMAALKDIRDTATLLRATRARYLTDGLKSLCSLPDASIDFAFSKAVLEHIRLAEFRPMMRALRRKLAPGGRCFHFGDLQDHLDHALNNLRFSDKIWESDWMVRSGFYTNRIGCSEMISAFEDAGFAVEYLKASRFEHMPTPRVRMARRFQDRAEQDLMVSGFSILLKPV
jgi:SAM-dependent methyltransferase